MPAPIPLALSTITVIKSYGKIIGTRPGPLASPNPHNRVFCECCERFAFAKRLQPEIVQRTCDRVVEYSPSGCGKDVPSLVFQGYRPDVQSLAHIESDPRRLSHVAPRKLTGKWVVGANQYYRADGQPYALGRKCNTIGQNSIIVVGDFSELVASEVVWKCEGLTDALALAALLPRGHVAVTVTNGANAICHELCWAFVNKDLYVVGDADEPGRNGALKSAFHAFHYARTVQVVTLPYQVEPSHGKDLRDFLIEGNSVDSLVSLAAPYSEHDYNTGLPSAVDH